MDCKYQSENFTNGYIEGVTTCIDYLEVCARMYENEIYNLEDEISKAVYGNTYSTLVSILMQLEMLIGKDHITC